MGTGDDLSRTSQRAWDNEHTDSAVPGRDASGESVKL
jgi:hypothetical protein